MLHFKWTPSYFKVNLIWSWNFFLLWVLWLLQGKFWATCKEATSLIQCSSMYLIRLYLITPEGRQEPFSEVVYQDSDEQISGIWAGGLSVQNKGSISFCHSPLLQPGDVLIWNCFSFSSQVLEFVLSLTP